MGGPSAPAKQGKEQVSASTEAPQSPAAEPATASSHWGENRLADVVKGTAKSKSNKDSPASNPTTPRANSPQQSASQASQTVTSRQASDSGAPLTKEVASGNTEQLASSTLALTPPSSPEK